jgi:hypothetical protein
MDHNHPIKKKNKISINPEKEIFVFHTSSDESGQSALKSQI